MFLTEFAALFATVIGFFSAIAFAFRYPNAGWVFLCCIAILAIIGGAERIAVAIEKTGEKK